MIGAAPAAKRALAHAGFISSTALVFAATAALTIRCCACMSSTPGMPMPGNWVMSMTWMRGPGETWLGAEMHFVVMWTAMMMAMMLPSLLPTLLRYQVATGADGPFRGATWTALLGVGYFFVWTVLGAAIFPLGAALAGIEMRRPMFAQVVPIIGGVAVVVAGALQFSAWKTLHLACCRDESSHGASQLADGGSAWRAGLRLGLHCVDRCANLTAILLVFGVMDLRAMAAVTAAITFERFAASGERAARIIGAIAIAGGAFLLARAFGLA